MTTPTHSEFLQMTTEYIAVEDRVRLSGKIQNDETVVLWLTQRLFVRVLPKLLQWLESQEAAVPQAAILSSFKQQAARATHTRQSPIRGNSASLTWLVHAVDIAKSPHALQLTFKGTDNQKIRLTMAIKPLRQWLNIVFDTCLKAGWSMDIWPEWMKESATPAPPQPQMKLH